MKTALARTAGWIPALAVLLACAVGALGAGAPSAPGLSTVTTILWLLGLGGAICLLLRRAIDADDRSRELAAQLARERGARQLADSLLQDTQTVLSRVVRQQDAMRDDERDRIARDIHEDLGQTLLSLRIELSLLQVASNGIHPMVHQKTGAMVRTLDMALRSLRIVVNGLRPLGPDERLDTAMARQLDEFTRLTGITHRFDAASNASDGASSRVEADALLYRVLQEVLSNISSQASATEVSVSLQHRGSEATLCIDDNGMAAREPGAACGCGLSSIRPRIEALGGSLKAATSPGRGTRLTLSLPTRHGMLAV
ncbi:sensor histidine kinase [Massilia niabensis]|uniref:Oxygen sensor histidine kinase NreB n=1 Tax=Massilia niabensis TaxID=544910 RepID=A0ABW0LET7_9BURK